MGRKRKSTPQQEPRPKAKDVTLYTDDNGVTWSIRPTGQPPYKCSKCGEKFNTSDQRRNHIEQHNAATKEP